MNNRSGYTFTAYLERVARRKSAHKSERAGQAYFNQLREDWPDKAENLRGSVIDPFYDDGRVPAFLSYLVIEWSNDDLDT